MYGKPNMHVRFRRNRFIVAETEAQLRAMPGGGKASPLPLEKRLMGYQRQNGHQGITARQARQAKRMEGRAIVREAKAELATRMR